MLATLRRFFSPKSPSARKRLKARRAQYRKPLSLRMEQLEGRALLASLVTDALDYHPGETVLLTASGYEVGEPVSFQVMSSTAGPGQDPWIVSDGIIDGGDGDLDGLADGNVTTSWLCDPEGAYVGAALTASAIGLTSGESATADFTDSGVIARAYPDNASGNPITTAPDEAVTYTIHCDETLSIGMDVYLSGGAGTVDMQIDQGDGTNASSYVAFSGASLAEDTTGTDDLFGADFADSDTVNVLDANLGAGAKPDPTKAHADVQVSIAGLAPGNYFFRMHVAGNSGTFGSNNNSYFNVVVTDDCDDGNDTFGTITIEGRKFEDLNGNGVDDTDPGIDGWGVSVTVGAFTNAITTGNSYTWDYATGTFVDVGDVGNGAYFITVADIETTDGPVLVNYSIDEVQQTGWTQTAGIGGYAGAVEVQGENGPSIADAIFGNFDNVDLCGEKFEDHNGDGVQDDGDQGLQGWTIALSGAAAGNVNVNVYSGYSDNGSGISFAGPVGSIGSSNVQFATDTFYNWHPFGESVFGADINGVLAVGADGTYSFSLDSDDGSYLFIDGNLVINNGGFHAPQFASGDATLTAGFHTFEVQFFEDAGGPSGVDLILPEGVTYAATTTTDANGEYCFTNLGPGTYGVQEINQPGWTQTYGNDGYTVTTTSGTDVDDFDFGNFENIDICGVKFQDHSGDGFVVNGTNLTPLAGFTINVYLDANNDGDYDAGIDTLAGTAITATDDPDTLVDETGTYCITNLGPGTYFVVEDASTQIDPANWLQTGQQGGTVIATSGLHSENNNFSNVHLGTQNGLTIGFYSNPNGQALLCTVVNGKPTTIVKAPIVSYLQTTLAKDATNSVLVNSVVSGKNTTYSYIPLASLSNYTVLQNFLKNASATNMANMLSAQLLATVLNSGYAAGVTCLANTGISASSVIYVGNVTTVGGAAGQSNAQIQTALEVGGTGSNTGVLTSSADDFVSVSELIAAAKKELCTNKITTATSADRTYQEALKNCFDAMNQSAPTLKQNIFVL